MADRRRLPWQIVMILLGFTLLSVGYALVSPPLENPDEMNHAEYAGFIGARHRLPTVDRDCVRLAFHPPLYHALLAPIARAMGLGPEEIMSGHRLNPDFATTGVTLVHGYPDETFPFSDVSRFVFVGRLLSIACGVVVLLYTYRLARLLSDDPITPVVAVALVAAIPQFEYLSASLSHDILAAALATMTLVYALRFRDDGTLAAASKCGLALGLGLLTKSSLVPLAIVPAFTLRDTRSGVARRLCGVALTYGMAGCVAGWWYVRNFQHYGHAVPTVQLHESTWIGTGLVHRGAADVAYVWAGAGQLFRSFWFLAGLMNVEAAPWMYWVWGAVSALGAAGMLVLWRDPRGRLLVGAWLVVLAAVVQYNRHIHSAQGRYLFIVAPVLGVAVASAITSCRPRWRRLAGGLLVAVTASLAVGCFAVFFRPTYVIAAVRQRPTEREIARLYCRNQYMQPIRVSGGRLHGLTIHARRLGDDDFDLEVALQRPRGDVIRRASLPSRELGARTTATTLWFEPLTIGAGEVFLVSFRAPAATPISRPLLAYAMVATSEGNFFTTKGSVGRGQILLREEYE
jgi:hypothetical protein